METDKLDKILKFLKKLSTEHKTDCWIKLFDDGSCQIMKSMYAEDDIIHTFDTLTILMKFIDKEK